MPGLFDRIKDTWVAASPTLLTTLSSFVVSGTAPGGYQTFSARYALAEGNIPVAIVSQTSNDWMTCWCTYTAANTLRVDTIMFSSNADAGVTFPAGTMDIFVTPAARAIPGLREVNTFTANNTFSATTFYGASAHGNIGSDATQMFVRGNNIAFQNAAASTTYAYINSSGNVGIGTSSPGEKLSVATGASEFAVEWSGPGKSWVLGSAAGRAYIRNKTDSVEAISILNAGNVGIGTTSPPSPLVVNTGTGNFDAFNGATGTISFGNGVASGTASPAIIGAASSSTALRLVGRSVDGLSSGDMSFDARPSAGGDFTTLTNPAFVFNRFGTNLATILRNGNVGIGTTGPSSKLSVSDGTVRIDLSPFSGTTGYVGTHSNHPLGIITNNAEVIRATTDGRVGIGTTNPSGYDAKLAVFNGNFALTTTTNRLYLYYASATNHAYLSAAAGGEILFSNGTAAPSEKMRIDTTGQVGIGGAPNTRLDVQSTGQNIITSRSTGSYAAFSRNVPTGQPGYDFCLINGVEVARITWSPSDILTFHTGSSAFERLRIDGNGNVGINVANNGTSAKLAISANSNQLTGAAVSTVLSTNAGALGTTATNELALGSLGFITVGGNQIMLGVRGYRFANGTDWTTTSIGLGMDVDNTVRAGGGIWFSANGGVGVGITAPEAAFHVARNAASETSVFVSNSNAGGYPAVRFGPSDRATNLDALIFAGDRFGVRSGNRPLVLETGSGTERMRIHTSGGVSIGSSADPGANTTAINATLRVLRQNTTSEGGELQFCRANDNSVSWYIDVLGSAAGTDPGAMRFVDNLGFDGSGAKVRAELSSRGVLSIVNDLGPTSTDTLAVGFRGSPNNDRSSAYTIALTDAGRTVRKGGTTAFLVSVPADSAVNFPIGSCIILCNAEPTSGNLTVQSTNTTTAIVYRNGTGRDSRTSANAAYAIAPGGSAMIRKVKADMWTITGSGIT